MNLKLPQIQLDCLQSFYYSTHAKLKASEAIASGATPTQSSISFCAGVQFPHDSIRAFNERIKTDYEKIEGCEQSKVYTAFSNFQ